MSGDRDDDRAWDPAARPGPLAGGEYREHQPPRGLAAWLDCLWERCDGGAAPVRVLPDGCIDIVWTRGAGTEVVGANTTAFLVSLKAGVHVVGARLRPGAAAALLDVDAAELRDGRAPLATVWGDDGRRLTDALETVPDGIATLLAALHARAAASPPPDPAIAAAVSRMRRANTTVAELSQIVNLSERQLRRRFETTVGYGPKRLGRVLRLQRALAGTHSGDGLARVACEAGYADQAHFAHECRALAGVSPCALIAR